MKLARIIVVTALGKWLLSESLVCAHEFFSCVFHVPTLVDAPLFESLYLRTSSVRRLVADDPYCLPFDRI